jgi:2-hydroxychromene-2-carboxylate isomerase
MADEAVLYFDFNSPYAYLATERIDSLIPEAEWKPFAFPILLHQQGRLEASLARDRSGVFPECSARAADRGLPPLVAPPGWVRDSWSLAPLRAAVHADDQGRLREFTAAAFRKTFVEGVSLTEPANLREAAREAGLDPDAVEAALARPEVKERVKRNTEEALAAGVTGIPTVAVGGELFWGDDRLEEAAEATRAA